MDKTEFEKVLDAIQGVATEQTTIREELAGIRTELVDMREKMTRVTTAVETIATEQARLREDMIAIGRRVGRVEAASADQWAAIDRLRPQN